MLNYPLIVVSLFDLSGAYSDPRRSYFVVGGGAASNSSFLLRGITHTNLYAPEKNSRPKAEKTGTTLHALYCDTVFVLKKISSFLGKKSYLHRNTPCAYDTKDFSDRTATQYDRLLASSGRPSVRPSLCNAVHCGSQGQYIGLKVVPACS